MNILNKLTFRSKVLFFTLLNVLFIWLIVFVSINYISRKTFKKQFLDEANTISKSVSMNLNDYILTQDYDSLSIQINNLLKNDEIIYAVVTDRNKNILYSNFYNQFPQDLLNLINSIPENTPKSYLINTEKGKVYHISQPLFDGRIGNLHIGFSLKNVEKAIRKLNLYIFITGIIMLIFGAIFSMSYAIYLSSPFKKLIRAADEVKRGNLKIKLKHEGNDEIATLTGAFNMMIDGIKENIRMLERAYRKTGTEEKVVAVRTLVQGIAEEINNPLTGIKHLTEIIKNSEKLGTERLQDYIKNITDGLERINAVIQELIKYTGEITDSIQQLELSDLINNACRIASEGSKKISYKNFIESKTIISGNGDYLTYAFVNLLKDLLNSDYRVMEISAKKMDGNVNIEIIGENPALNQKLPTEYDNSSLSLNISFRIIEMHGGSVEIQLHGGVKKFIINLPCEANLY